MFLDPTGTDHRVSTEDGSLLPRLEDSSGSFIHENCNVHVLSIPVCTSPTISIISFSLQSRPRYIAYPYP